VFELRDDGDLRRRRRRRPRARSLIMLVLSLVVEVGVLRARGYGLGGNVVVRCRRGHLYTTIWIPAVSVKSLRLGWWRLQRCPTGRHWSLVTPVDRSRLSRRERRTASAVRDIRLP
jgi:hypothetical protein